MGGDGEQPRVQRAASLKFREESLAIWPRSETIRPQIGGQILRFGFTRAAGAENADDFALITPAQFGGCVVVPRQHALGKGEILFVSRSGRRRRIIRSAVARSCASRAIPSGSRARFFPTPITAASPGQASWRKRSGPATNSRDLLSPHHSLGRQRASSISNRNRS